MSADFPEEAIRPLLLEYLSKNYTGNYISAVKGVIVLAKSKKIYNGAQQTYRRMGGESYDLNGDDHYIVPEKIRQLFWEFLIQSILVFGSDDVNPNWPDYRLTEYGEIVTATSQPQPYDPDGFISFFNNQNQNIDPIITDYLYEGVLTFNKGCFKASSVMLGCASEQIVLILHGSFENAIKDPVIQEKFKKTYKWNASSKYTALYKGLEYMLESKKLSYGDYGDAVYNNLAGLGTIIKKHRDNSGHPNLLTSIRRENLFLMLTIFGEYVYQTYRLIEYFKVNEAFVNI